MIYFGGNALEILFTILQIQNGPHGRYFPSWLNGCRGFSGQGAQVIVLQSPNILPNDVLIKTFTI